MLTEREKEVLNCLVQCWDENPKLPGHLSYEDIYALVEKFGLDRPRLLDTYLANPAAGWPNRVPT